MDTNHLQALADSAAWKRTRDTLIADKLFDLKDVTKVMDVNMDVSPQDMYLAKLLASEVLENIVDSIDRYADSTRKTQDNSME